MEIYNRKKTAEPYFRELIGKVEEITRKWSVIQEKKDHVEQLLMTISIDFSAQEIQEIREAVVELLTRYKDKINDRERYKICRIERCGSMREYTAMWKSGTIRLNTRERQSSTYTEFEYLGVLKKPCYKININPRKCCAKVKKSDIDKPCSCEVPNCSCGIEPDMPGRFDDAFREELCKSVESLCDCYCMYRDKLSKCYNLRQKSREQQQRQRGCDKCAVYKPTGQLHIDTEIEGIFPHSSYSLKLMWTSDAMTLVAPEGDITGEIKTTSPIKRLLILIDFLPALEVVNTQMNEGELEHECFLVPKRCRSHYRDGTWKLFGCVREIDHIVNKMSEKHRKCYKILKYMCDSYYGIPSYHVKTSALNHSVTCSDSSEDYRNCVTAVLEELKIAYERRVLESFCYNFNLLEDSVEEIYWPGIESSLATLHEVASCSGMSSPISKKRRLQVESDTRERERQDIYDRLLRFDEVSDFMKFFDRSSNDVKLFLDWLCNYVKTSFKNACTVWAGYHEKDQFKPVLVAIVEEKETVSAEVSKKLKIIQRKQGQVSSEATYVADKEIKDKIKFTYEERFLIRKCLTKHTANLMQKHSNLLIVSASAIKAKHHGCEDANYIKKACIVLYVNVKGIIPFNEEPFPSELEGFPVDVREGTFKAFPGPKDFHERLQMGCHIETAYSTCGTLGAFVQLDDGEIGCLTCCHVFYSPEMVKDWQADRSRLSVMKTQVYQPQVSQDFEFGTLIDLQQYEGDNENIGVDAAVIKIIKHDRYPSSGGFPDAVSDIAGFSPEKPMVFSSGEIIQSFGDVSEECVVVKYGAASGHTIGLLHIAGSAVYQHPLFLYDNDKLRLHQQFEIFQLQNHKFADKGDSGSLVFLKTTGRIRIRALGLLVGGTSYGSVIVTPIWAVLNRLKLPLKLISFEGAEGHVFKSENQRLDKVESDVDTLKNSLATIEQRTQKTEGKVDQISAKLDTKFDSMYTNLERLFKSLPKNS